MPTETTHHKPTVVRPLVSHRQPIRYSLSLYPSTGTSTLGLDSLIQNGVKLDIHGSRSQPGGNRAQRGWKDAEKWVTCDRLKPLID